MSGSTESGLNNLQQNQVWKIVISVGVAGFSLLSFLGYWGLEAFAEKKAKEAAIYAAREVAGSVAAEQVAGNILANPEFFTLIQDRLGDLPSNAVIAVSGVGCPSPGWKELSKAAGRYILGATSEVGRRPGDTGGQTQVRLEAIHLPPHDHRIPTVGSNQRVQNIQSVDAENLGDYEQHSRSTDSAGEGRPFEIIPPFIALTICERLPR
jgi:hypothetical protein